MGVEDRPVDLVSSVRSFEKPNQDAVVGCHGKEAAIGGQVRRVNDVCRTIELATHLAGGDVHEIHRALLVLSGQHGQRTAVGRVAREANRCLGKLDLSHDLSRRQRLRDQVKRYGPRWPVTGNGRAAKPSAARADAGSSTNITGAS